MPTRNNVSTAPAGLTEYQPPVKQELTEAELDSRIANLRAGTDTLPNSVPKEDYFRIRDGITLCAPTSGAESYTDRVSGTKYGTLPATGYGSNRHSRPDAASSVKASRATVQRLTNGREKWTS